jgi:ubiquinone/menaquinone biosynthesis C-methylase UbiE
MKNQKHISKINLSKFTRANMRAWDQVAPKHQAAMLEKVKKLIAKGHPFLDRQNIQMLQALKIKNKSVAHLCCNSGVELITIAQLGAKNSIGFDFSAGFIDLAKNLSIAGHVKCDFIRANVYEIPPRFFNKFDFVFVSVGTLGWMPDLSGFFRFANRLLKKKGIIFLNDTHPVMNMMSIKKNHGAKPIYSYFRKLPIIETQGLDYIGNSKYKPFKKYWFQHTLSDIFESLLSEGFHLDRFLESPKDQSQDFKHLKNEKISLPMMMTILASKT